MNNCVNEGRIGVTNIAHRAVVDIVNSEMIFMILGREYSLNLSLKSVIATLKKNCWIYLKGRQELYILV